MRLYAAMEGRVECSQKVSASCFSFAVSIGAVFLLGGCPHTLRHTVARYETCAALSSPACGGGAEQAKRREAEGGEARVPSVAAHARHLPRKRGRIRKV